MYLPGIYESSTFSTSLPIFVIFWFVFCFVIAFWVSVGGTLLWFWFTFFWWLIMLGMFSWIYWPWIYLLWNNVCFHPLPFFFHLIVKMRLSISIKKSWSEFNCEYIVSFWLIYSWYLYTIGSFWSRAGFLSLFRSSVFLKII